MTKDKIGETAGVAWHMLEKQGPLTMTALCREMPGSSSREVLMALGWLARENQVEFLNRRRTTKIMIRRHA